MIRLRNRVTLCAAGLIAVTGCSHEQPYQKPPTPVQVGEVQLRPAARGLRYSAAIEPARRVDLAFRVGGYVSELATVDGHVIREGDVVAAGTRLAAVRAEDYDVKVRQAQAALAEAEAARRAATQGLARAEKLYAAGSLTKPELEQAQATAESIEAKMGSARAVIREAQLAKQDAALTAPIHGVVLKRLIEVGSLVGPGTPGFVMADTNEVKVVVGIPDTMLSRFVVGTHQRIASDALTGRTFDGRVTNVSPAADPRTRLFEAELTVTNRDGALKPGMIATVDVGSGEEAAAASPVSVPLSAVIRPPGEQDGYAVFVIDETGGSPTGRLRRVRLGELTGNDVVVVDGLRRGERIVIQGAALIADGERVNPTR